MPSLTACTNCGAVLADNYCASCGERQPGHHDLSVGHFVHDVVHEFVHLDSKLFRTLRLLVARPGFLTEEYLQGPSRARFRRCGSFSRSSPCSAWPSRFTGRGSRGLAAWRTFDAARSETSMLRDRATARPRDPATKNPSNPATQHPSNPTTTPAINPPKHLLH
jgi:hypothetical protein